MRTIRTIAFTCLLLGVGGCANTGPVGIVTPDYGNAVRQNMAVETINPMAPNDKSALTTEGQRAALAQRRYVTDTVIKPAITTTTLSGAGGGGGGGGGTGGTGGTGGAGIGAGPVQ